MSFLRLHSMYIHNQCLFQVLYFSRRLRRRGFHERQKLPNCVCYKTARYNDSESLLYKIVYNTDTINIGSQNKHPESNFLMLFIQHLTQQIP